MQSVQYRVHMMCDGVHVREEQTIVHSQRVNGGQASGLWDALPRGHPSLH